LLFTSVAGLPHATKTKQAPIKVDPIIFFMMLCIECEAQKYEPLHRKKY
jgi:hypothetical protein